MEKIKEAVVEAHESLRLILFQMEHLRSDFENEMPKNQLGKELSDQFNELAKTAQATVYDCADYCFSLNECENLEDLHLILQGVTV